MSIIKVIIPAFNEQNSIAKVIRDIPSIVDEIIVVSNNSIDKTEENAKNAGATVLQENLRLRSATQIKNQTLLFF